MIHTDYCSRCKRKGVRLHKHNKNAAGTIQYYYCTDCSNNRAKLYYLKTHGISTKKTTDKMWTDHRKETLARAKVNYAVKVGKLVKPSSCEVCAMERKVEGHHPDYNKPLQVIWVCPPCHADIHKAQTDI